MSAIAIRQPLGAVPPRAAAAREPQAALLAEFAQALVRTLLQGVHDAANLNVATVHALLAPGDGNVQADLGRLTESWRFSWRAYEISATTAANVMRLTEAHARSGSEALWRLFERTVDGAPSFDGDNVARLRHAFDGLRAAQLAAFNAAIEAHRCLITLATGAR
jgi:hypothetical protein